MPPPPSRRYATPASEFGIAKPVNEWFDFAAAGSPQTGPSFSRGLDEADTRATQRELESIRLQRELQGEQAASEFLAQAAGQNPRGLMQMLADSPELLTSGAAPAIQNYVSQRMAQQQEQQAKRNQFSSKVLAPSLMKSLPPAQQLQLSRKIDAGMSITDAFDELEAEEMQQAASAKMRQLALDAAKAGANPQDISAAMQSPDPELYLASLSSKKTTKTGHRYTQDDLNKAREYVLALEEEGVPKTDPRYVRGLARFDAIDLALDEDIFGPAAVKEQPAPGSAEAIEAERLAKEKADLEKKTPTSAATPTALSPFEQQMQASRAGSEAQKLALNQAWTGAKDETMTGLLPDSNIQPQRLVSLAQQAALGNPLTGVTPQEKQLAERISQFALRAAEGKQIQVGTEAGEGGVVPVLQSPGFALLEQFGMDPNETVTISGAGMMGGDKEIKAWEVMDLRLKEIAQPFLQKRKESSQMTPETQSAYERAKAKAAGLPTPNP
jgi:hypothetical protein